MDNLMEASTAIDHPRHVRGFTDRLKRIVTLKHLRKVQRRSDALSGLPILEINDVAVSLVKHLIDGGLIPQPTLKTRCISR
jgi:hypothetical protein